MAKSKRVNPRKPAGTLGTAIITSKDIKYKRVEFPGDKTASDTKIASEFLDAMRAKDDSDWLAIQQNQEDDFDFTVATQNGLLSLELMEVAPIESGESYDSSSATREIYGFSRWVYNQIQKKSRHYGSKSPSRIVLLLYSTDWKFLPSSSVELAIQFWLSRSAHVFEAVYWYSPNSKVADRLFPVAPGILEAYDAEQIRNRVEVHVRPDSAVFTRDFHPS